MVHVRSTEMTLSPAFTAIVDFEISATGKQSHLPQRPRQLTRVCCHPDRRVCGLLSALGGRTVPGVALLRRRSRGGWGCTGFCRFSGQGKTTVATLLCADGYALVTDDLLPVDVQADEVTCVPETAPSSECAEGQELA